MTTLDVALRLKLINQLSGGAKQAARDLAGIKSAAGSLGSARGPDKIKRDILDVATASRQADRNLRDVRREAAALGSVRGPDRLKRDMLDLASAGQKAERSVAGARRAAQEGRGARGHDSAGRPSRGGVPAVVGGTPGMIGSFGGGYLAYRTVSGGARSVVDQDKAWAEVLKKVNGASPQELAALQAQLRRIAVKYGLEVAETFSQAAEAGAAGIDKGDLVRFVEQTTMASVGWDTTARETAQRLAEIKAGTSMTIQEMDDLANKINALGDNSAAKERDIVEMFHRSGAAAKAAGVQYDDTLAILTAIRSTGMQEEVASRWFNAFAFDLAGAHTKGDKVQDAWKLLGFDPKAISQGMTKDATGTIMKVFDAINKLDQMKKVEVLSKIFGQGWQDETARAAQAVAEVRKQLDYIRDQKNWQGSLKTNLDIQMATIDSHWKRLTASVTNAAEALDRVSGASSGFKDLSEGLKSAFEWASGVMTNAAKRNEEIERNKRRQEAARRERQLMEDLQAKEAAVATAERDPGPFDPGGLMRLNIDPQDARRRLERLRMERTELQLAVEATKERPALDLTPSPPPRPAASALPHKPKRLPVDLPPVQILEDIVPRTAEGKVRASMDGLNRALAEGGDKAVAESKSIVERIKELFGSLNFTVTPTISPRFGGGPAGGPGSAVPQSAPAPATGAPLQRQARAGGLVITGPVSFHGIRDLAGAHRELARLADRDVAEARDSALHDTWTYA